MSRSSAIAETKDASAAVRPTAMMRYPFVRPVLPAVAEWSKYLEIPYARRYFTNFGELDRQFSQALSERYADGHLAVTLACNATAALTAALIGLGVTGKVAVSSFTFPATLQAIIAAGCVPVACDVEPDTCEMSATTLAELLSEHDCAAVMPVRPYGFIRDLSPIYEIAAKHGVPVVVDAAAALGNARVQCPGHVVEVFSLHATKSFAIGEGGAVFSSSALRPAIMRALNFGLLPDRRFGHGLNGKMAEFQAAVGLAQMNHVSEQVERRSAMAAAHSAAFRKIPSLSYPANPGPTPWSVFPVLLPPGCDVDALEKASHSRGMFLRRYYAPSINAGYVGPGLIGRPTPVADDLSLRAVCVPVYADASLEEISEIQGIFCDSLADVGII